MTLRTAPLGKLVPSAANVRKTGGVPIDNLAASIASSGLLNNLVVRPHLRDDGTPTDKYEVVAGGRRLAALKRLAKQKRVAKNMAVPCNILEDGNATEASLAENVIRQAMLGSVSKLSCWARTAVMVPGDIHRTYRGRHVDVRVKRSRSEARTTLEAAA